MLIYNGSKAQFDSDVKNNVLAQKINSLFWECGLCHENEREYISWQNSLSHMQRILDDPSFSGDIQIAIEYQIPQTAKRVDFIIAGENEFGEKNAIIIELKQWTSATRTSRNYVVKTYLGGKDQDVIHPSYQAYSYAKTIENYNSTIYEHRIFLHPCAYLHNYKSGQKHGIEDATHYDIISESPIFIKSDDDKLRDYIKRYVTKPSKTNIMYEIDHGKIRPTKAVQDALCSMLSGNTEFFLLDEQLVVFETVKKLLFHALQRNEKFTVIIEGGPGTGKSVVAIQLLAELIKEGYNAQYVTKNAAPRNVYFDKLRKGNYKWNYIKNVFKGSGSYVNSNPNEVDCLLIDEAHRLVEKSGYYNSNGENQIKEIINAAKVSVFFVDEAQIVTAKDIGKISEIKKWAIYHNSKIFHNESTVLHSQFRCNGSNSYIAFLEDLLQMQSHPELQSLEMDYEIKLFENPTEMKAALYEKNLINNKARMLAGYCYEWKTKNEKNRNSGIFDIELPYDFHAKWNFNDNDKIWAIDENSFDQVGCIHTSQGLEFDYIGVIIGKDLRFVNGQVITDPSQHPRSDISFKDSQKRSCSPEFADFIIRNTYKTLLTRGQKGCYIYCEDQDLSNYVKGKLLDLI